jgi:hypothetical protein
MAEKGYMIIADITGYTKFISKTELDHAHEILESLLNTIVNRLHNPLKLAKIEGDAVFSYTSEENYIQGQTFLESLEQVYFSFADELQSSDRNTSCPCNACQRMSGLDLKIVVHFGEYMLQKIGPQTELVGNDVNLTHRLLKNNIVEKTGVETYIFFTQPAADQMYMSDFSKTLVPHSESYDHVGEVSGYVYDLLPAWTRERERRRIFITPQEAEIHVTNELPVPPAVAWDYLNDPGYKTRFMHSDNVEVDNKNGRIDVGSIYHCAHGEDMINQEILDWAPFHYFTMNIFLPLPKMITAPVRCTIRLTPTDTGCQVEYMFSPPIAEKKLYQKIADIAWKKKEREAMKVRFEEAHRVLLDIIKEDRESGKLKMKIIAA